MFPTAVQFTESTMTIADTPGTRTALCALCSSDERFPESTLVKRVVQRHGFTLETVRGGLYEMEPSHHRPTEEHQRIMRRLLNVLAPCVPCVGSDDNAPRIEWQAVEDESRRYTWRVIAGVLNEYTESATGPEEFAYEYNVRYNTVRRERLYLSRQQAQELLSDPLHPLAGELERARVMVNPWDDEEVGEETAEVEPESVCRKTA